MSKVSCWFPATCLVALLAAAAPAQTAPKPLPAPQTGSTIPSRPLLLEPAIQKEIGLTAKQRNNLELIENDAQEARQSTMEDPGEEGFDFNAMMGGMDETAKLQRAAVAKILTATQKTRLAQIEWQRQGWLALARPDVATKIKLNSPQTQKIRGIIDSMRQQQSQALFAVPDDPARSRKAGKKKPNLDPAAALQGTDDAIPGGGPMAFTTEGMQAQAARTAVQTAAAHAGAALEVEKVITPEQKAAFERVLGPPFDFKRLDEVAPPNEPTTSTSKRGAPATRKTPKGR